MLRIASFCFLSLALNGFGGVSGVHAQPQATEALRVEGIHLVVHQVEDLENAQEWYAALLGEQPYEATPTSVTFHLGRDVLRLGQAPEGKMLESSQTTVFWQVSDAERALSRLLVSGAKLRDPLVRFQDGTISGAVVDPFGIVLGLIQVPKHKP